MKVNQPNLRDVAFDCPWNGHEFDPNFVIRNSTAPNVIGQRCAKCGCLIYLFVEPSKIVGPGGELLPKGATQ